MKPSLILALCLICNAGFAQDSLVTQDDLHFTSDFEKITFTNYFKNGEVTPFALLIANGKILNEKSIDLAFNNFEQHLSTLNNEKLLSKKNDKKIKAIYDDIHATFLRKYELQNRFEEIFVNGYYNCVSASALYALAFDYLKVPYVIKEKPTHIYLIAYPQQDRILVETTTPAGGFMAINQQFKQSYVKILKDQKLISTQEYTKGNINELFDRFYFGEDQDITVNQLIGVQYSNAGIYELENKNNVEALHQFQKSYVFYPKERVAYMMLAAAHEVFKGRSAKDSVHAATLEFLSRFRNYGITSDMIKGEYSNVVRELLFEQGQAEKLKKYNSVLLPSLKDDALRVEIDFFYHFEHGRMLYNQARYKDAIPFYEQCLVLKPGNQEAMRILISCVAESIRTKQNSEAIIALESYSKKYPLLLENNNFNEMLGTSYLMEMRNNFAIEKISDGEKFRKSFEDFRANYTEVAFNPYLVGEAYSAAAVCYFRKGNSSKAKILLNKGLEISPNNHELNTRKRMIH